MRRPTQISQKGKALFGESSLHAVPFGTERYENVSRSLKIAECFGTSVKISPIAAIPLASHVVDLLVTHHPAMWAEKSE